MDMHALDAVQAGASLDADDAAVMLDSGHELGKHIPDPARKVKLWRPDVRAGLLAQRRFKVGAHPCACLPRLTGAGPAAARPDRSLPAF